MSKIMVLANHYNTLRIFRRELLIALHECGHEVRVVIPPCDDENKRILEGYGCEVLFLDMERRGMNPVKDLGLFSKYMRLLGEYRPELVITYTIKCNIYGAYACKLKHIPCYANVTGLGSAFQTHGKTRMLVSFMYHHSLNKAKKVFFENSGNRDTLVDDGIIRPEQAVVMAGAGVNLEEFRAMPYPTEENGVKFLFVGRIMQEKGVDELFEAIPVICKQYPGTLFEFIGWYEDDYKEKVEALEWAGYIRFSGWQAEVRPFYESSHCIVLPSWHEGMSNTLLEGAASARPLITNAIHGCMEAVEDGVTGFLCERKSAESLIEKMDAFLRLPHNEKAAMGMAGRKKMEREFDKHAVVEKTLRELGLLA